MPYTFDFYMQDSEVDLTEFKHRAGQLVVIASHAELERRGYARLSYEVMVVSRRPNRIARPAALQFTAQVIRRGHGERSMAHKPSILLVTLCAFQAAEQGQFLNQFDRGLSFIQGKPGFFASRLFRECNATEPIRFVNIAHWADLNSFQSVFHDPAFDKIVSTAFRPASQVMLAEIPSAAQSQANDD